MFRVYSDVICILYTDSGKQYISKLQSVNNILLSDNKVNANGVHDVAYGEKSGVLILNGVNCNGFSDAYDEYRKQTDIDITLFVGDTRRATSIHNDDGSRNIGTKASDELGALARNTKDLRDKLSEIIRSIREKAENADGSAVELAKSASTTATSAEDVTAAVGEIANGAASQAEPVQDGVMAIKDILNGVTGLADNINMADGKASDMSSAYEGMKNNFDKLGGAMEKTTHSLDNVSQLMQTVGAFVKQVQDSADAINSIASQTNLLSLNASIEAAHAEEAGRGY